MTTSGHAALDALLSEILKREGWPAYTNDPHDRGGPTKGGITQATLAAWRGRPVTPDEVSELQEAEARNIYLYRYVRAPGFAEISDELLRHQVVDAGVLHGPRRAARWLQEALGDVAVDGQVGALTLGSLGQRDPHSVGLLFCRQRLVFLGRILADNHGRRRRGETAEDWSRFSAGWINRASSFLELEALAGSRAREAERWTSNA